MIISKRLKELRNEKKLKQTEVAEFLGMSISGYAGYEQGVRKIPVNLIVELSDYYGVTSDYLLGKTDIRYTQDELKFYNDIKEKGIIS
jgi:transcriptional regulator with XRE-family HTH domain